MVVCSSKGKWLCSLVNWGAVSHYPMEIDEKCKFVYECTVNRTEIQKLTLLMNK